jgi:hypothetical protein
MRSVESRRRRRVVRNWVSIRPRCGLLDHREPRCGLLDGRVTDDDLLLGGDRQPQDQVQHELGSGEEARNNRDHSHRIAPDAETVRDASADSGDNFSIGGSSEFSHDSSVAPAG